MAAKSSEWRPGPTVCRCCLTEGCYKDISTEYFWMGKREVYAEMLKDTLDVSIAYSKAGGPNSNSRLICEPCISRLRDATEFKRQVVECERMFMQHLDPGSSSLNVDLDPEPLDKIKIEGVKLEKGNSDDDFDDRQDFGLDDDDDDDDDLDNQPLTKLASKVPKKESVDLLDLLDNSKAAEKRKATTKAKAPPPKKAKAKVEAPKPKPTSSKPKPEKKKKVLTPMFYARQNAQAIVEFTTAYPFKLPESSMVCVHCCDNYDDPAVFRQHMSTVHQEFSVRASFAHIPEGYIKVDCSDLKCRECFEKFEKVEDAANHLLTVHFKPIDFNYDLGVQPFRFVNDQLACALCPVKFSTLRALSRHTQTHFRKCTCETCGKSFLTTSALQHHVRFTHTISSEQRICEKCKVVFESVLAKRKHLAESPNCWRYSCNICFQRFKSGNLRNVHQKEAHGIQKRTYVCPECKMVFPDMNKFSIHFKANHRSDDFVAAKHRFF